MRCGTGRSASGVGNGVDGDLTAYGTEIVVADIL